MYILPAALTAGALLLHWGPVIPTGSLTPVNVQANACSSPGDVVKLAGILAREDITSEQKLAEITQSKVACQHWNGVAAMDWGRVPNVEPVDYRGAIGWIHEVVLLGQEPRTHIFLIGK